MKTKLLKSSSILLTILILNCQDVGDKNLDVPALSQLNETVGKQIPYELAQEWLENLNNKISETAGKKSDPAFSMDAVNLDNVLSSVINPVGLVFQYGVDDQGLKHIIVIPLDATLSLWAPASQVIVDANTNTIIEQSKARTWAEQYQRTFPEQVRSHFFGINIFNEIKTIKGFSIMDIKPALDGEDQPQLLLYILRNGQAAGKTKGDPAGVYDASVRCPNTCP